MRRGIFIVGIVLIVLGLVFVGVFYALSMSQQSVTATPGSVLSITPTSIGSATLSASWSGGATNTQVVLATCTDSTCHTLNSPLATGSGPSGSFSTSMTPGTTYAIEVTRGNAPVTLTYSASGVSTGMILGIVLAIVGAVLAVFGARARAKVPQYAASFESSEPAEVAPAAPYARPPPITPETAAATGAVATEPIGVRPPPPAPPPRFMPASAVPNAAPSQPTTGARPNQTCSYCGTVNESWITNCRKCKRPLTSTGTR